MLARVITATPWGIDACRVWAEIDVRYALPGMQIVGLPDTAVRESRERVRTAIRNCGYKLPARSVIVNLAPADVRKEGTYLDLPIALGVLTAFDELPGQALEGRMICGELGLDGAVRPIRGALSIADLGHRLGVAELLVPAVNAPEAAALDRLPVIPVEHLRDAIGHLTGVQPVPPCAVPTPGEREGGGPGPDLADVRGQETAKRALEIAASGGHNLLFVGPPGSGKTMLARRLPGLLPPLTLPEAIEVTKIHSHAGGRPPRGLVTRRPFRSPHSSVSTAGLVGGGTLPRPGEASLAHCGVLFLDELPEFRREALEALRQPLEDGAITIVRARGGFRFPARFALLASMNPCQCGHLGDPRHECRCTPPEIERYRKRISGPLLDRIDLHVEVPAVTLGELKGTTGESSQPVAERVLAAREMQQRRFADAAVLPVNAAVGDAQLRRYCPLNARAQKLLDSAFERLGLSARAITRILKVSRTIADLSGRERIHASDIAEAIQYRSLDRRLPN